MKLTNPFIGYTDRSYIQIKQAILAKIANPDPNIGIPEITDHSDSNPFVKRVSIWAGIAEMLSYYIDNLAHDAFLITMRLYENAIRIARQYDYRVRGAIAATGEVIFTINNTAPSNINIPIGTEVKTEDGIRFLTIAVGTIVIGQTSVVVPVKQWVKTNPSVIGQSNGMPNQVFVLGTDIVDGSISVVIDNVTTFNPIDTFVFSTGANNHFIAQMNEESKMQIEFGDGINGAIPLNSKDVMVGWYVTDGVNGNIGTGLISIIVSTITLPGGINTITVTNLNPITGGTDYEDLTKLQKLLPLSLRTLYRAVTRTDYVYVTELAPGVAKAGLDYTCGKTVDIYIAPNGGGIASPTLLGTTYDFLENRKMITTKHRMFSAGEVIVKHVIDVVAKPNVLNADCLQDVLDALDEFYDIENQAVGGKVNIGDVYETIENLATVDHSEVRLLSPVPYARPMQTGIPILDWTRNLKITSTNATYDIIFISSTQFRIFRNNAYQGTFDVDTNVDLIDVIINITGTYSAGNKYRFQTYGYNVGTLILTEPSLPVFNPSAIYCVITVTGGIV